jgi:hypothetical protein
MAISGGPITSPGLCEFRGALLNGPSSATSRRVSEELVLCGWSSRPKSNEPVPDSASDPRDAGSVLRVRKKKFEPFLELPKTEASCENRRVIKSSPLQQGNYGNYSPIAEISAH